MVQHRILTGSGTLTIPAGVTSFTATGSGQESYTYVVPGGLTYSWLLVETIRTGDISESYPNSPPSPPPRNGNSNGEFYATDGYIAYGNGMFERVVASWCWGLYTSTPDTTVTVPAITVGFTVSGAGSYSFSSAAQSTRTVVLKCMLTSVTQYSMPSGGYLKIEW